MLHVRQSSKNPYEVVLGVGPREQLYPPEVEVNSTVPALMDRTRIAEALSRSGNRSPLAAAIRAASAEPRSIARRPLVGGRRSGSLDMLSSSFDLGSANVGRLLDSVRRAIPTRYEWDFGDGRTVVTQAPQVSHDYFSKLDHAAGTSTFHVTCRVAHENLTVTRTLTVLSAYAMCRQRGALVPHVENDIFAHKRYLFMTAVLTVHNVESFPLVLDQMSVVPLTDDPDDPATPPAFQSLGTTIVIPAKGATVINVNVPFGTGPRPDGVWAPYDAPGFTVYYAGHGQARQSRRQMPVRVSATFEIPIGERDILPHFPTPEVPEGRVREWPWEVVVAALDEVVDPSPVAGGIGRRDVVLDRITATMAVHIGAAGTSLRGGETRVAVDRICETMMAPVYKAASASGTLPLSIGRTYLNIPTRIGASRVERASDLGLTRSRIPAGALLRRPPGRSIPMSGGPPPNPPPPPPGPVAAGGICDPDNLTEAQLAQAEAGQLVCQLTDEEQEVLMPGRFMNARKGDVILSPGGSGLIGQLLRALDPPQWHSHSGIMTRNYDEVTHSTASEERIANQAGTDGVVPNILKYGWPGVVAQSVEDAIHGEPFVDPEFGDTYQIHSFSPHSIGVSHNDQFVVVPPLVVKPDPLQETPAVRAALHAVAADARSGAGRPNVHSKSHYRFFCYTDPTIGLSSTAPANSGWAAGSYPSVCSSFIWKTLHQRNATLETATEHTMPADLEPQDVAEGAFVKPGTLDGLYTYTAAERLNGAELIYQYFHDLAYEEAGWFGNLLTDVADDLGNQVCNTFASDDANGQDSEAWRTTTDSSAVSPDDIIWWDPPTKGGLYGYTEPLQYREPRTETYRICRWKRVLTRGNISGKVTFGGAPVAGAQVQVYEGKSAITAGGGTYSLNDVPFGSYYIKAWKVIDGVYMSTQKWVSLSQENLTVDLVLEQPAERFRLAEVYIDFWGKDEEYWPESDEIHDPGPEFYQRELGPDRLTNSISKTYKWGGEVRAEYTIVLRLLVNNTVDVEVRCLLYEGTSETTSDLDGQGVLTFQVPIDQTGASVLTVTNTEENDDDRAELTITVKNSRNHV
jgi:PKD repeat protein